MSSKGSSSLKELKGLREAVLAEEKAKTQARMQNLPEAEHRLPAKPPAVLDPPSVVEPEEVDQYSDETPEVPPVIPEPPPDTPAQPAPPTEQPASSPSSPKKPPKEPALIIPLTPKILDRLKRNVENARWSPAQLVIELIHSALHQGYPAIQFGDQLVARSGTYRAFERNPLESTLKISSGQGVFRFVVTPENSDYQHWLSYFGRQKSEDPEKSAHQVCLFSLQSHLESVDDFTSEGWSKNISVEDYSILPGD